MSTAHNEANKGDISKIVLMSGDPLRIKYIADHYLENVTCFNTVRNMFGFRGTYQGIDISLMGSGMGMASMGIYAYELFNYYDVEVIIRIGSAGSYSDKLKVRDLLLVSEAYSESNFAYQQNGSLEHIMYPSAKLNEVIKVTSDKLKMDLKEGRIHTSDVFYYASGCEVRDKMYQENHCLAVEMESFALFSIAKQCQKHAACLLTVSDSLVTKEELDASERANGFNNMIVLALESAKEMLVAQAK